MTEYVRIHIFSIVSSEQCADNEVDVQCVQVSEMLPIANKNNRLACFVHHRQRGANLHKHATHAT